MNFLAHCHIAHTTNTSVLGSLLGDFAKGPVESLPYDESIKLGIALHRAVDTFTDNHNYTQTLKAQLGQWRRFGGIVLDVFYDHQLAIHFERVSDCPLEEFSQMCYRQMTPIPAASPKRFKRVIDSMTTMDWLSGYGELSNIERALQGISQRLSANVDLTACLAWYEDNQAAFSQLFLTFYRELVIYSQEYVENTDL